MGNYVEARRSLASSSSLSKNEQFLLQMHGCFLDGGCLLEVLVNGADGIGVGWSTFVPTLGLPQKTVKRLNRDKVNEWTGIFFW